MLNPCALRVAKYSAASDSRQVADQRLRRIAGHQERVAVPIDEVPPVGADPDRPRPGVGCGVDREARGAVEHDRAGVDGDLARSGVPGIVTVICVGECCVTVAACPATVTTGFVPKPLPSIASESPTTPSAREREDRRGHVVGGRTCGARPAARRHGQLAVVDAVRDVELRRCGRRNRGGEVTCPAAADGEVALASNPDPLTVTRPPVGPLVGEKPVIRGTTENVPESVEPPAFVTTPDRSRPSREP